MNCFKTIVLGCAILVAPLLAQADPVKAEATKTTTAPIAPAASLPASIPFKRDAPAEKNAATSASLAFMGTLAFLVLLIYVARRYRRPAGKPLFPLSMKQWLASPPASDLQVIASTGLGVRNRAYVVQWQGRQFLIAGTEQSVTLLAERTLPASELADPSKATS